MKFKPNERNFQLSSESMKILYEVLKVELPEEEVLRSIAPLDSSIMILPDQYDVKKNVEEVIKNTIALSRENKESVYKIYAMCASIVAGASTVVACLYEQDGDT